MSSYLVRKGALEMLVIISIIPVQLAVTTEREQNYNSALWKLLCKSCFITCVSWWLGCLLSWLVAWFCCRCCCFVVVVVVVVVVDGGVVLLLLLLFCCCFVVVLLLLLLLFCCCCCCCCFVVVVVLLLLLLLLLLSVGPEASGPQGEKAWPNFYCGMPTVWLHLCVQLWAVVSSTASLTSSSFATDFRGGGVVCVCAWGGWGGDGKLSYFITYAFYCLGLDNSSVRYFIL